MNAIASEWSFELKFGMHITDYRRTNSIDFSECRLHSFFTGVTKKNSCALRPMKSNSLKCARIRMMHSIELIFGMYTTGHGLYIVSILVNLGLIFLLQEITKKNSYILQPVE